jgi:hypothetical protein
VHLKSFKLVKRFRSVTTPELILLMEYSFFSLYFLPSWLTQFTHSELYRSDHEDMEFRDSVQIMPFYVYIFLQIVAEWMK